MTDEITIDRVRSTSTGVDYTRLVEKFGCKLIDEVLKKTLPDIHFIARDIFFAHRDVDKIGSDFYIYTGRGPSSASIHLGHLIPFMFAQQLQKIYGVHVVIQITDDEKFYRDDKTLLEIREFGKRNVEDILSCGFIPEKTTIFFNSDTVNPALKHNVMMLSKLIKLKDLISSFGFKEDMNMGQIFFPIQQMAPAFSSSFPNLFQTKKRCLIIAGIDQDPYFRLMRDVAEKMGEFKPSIIYAKFLPGLMGKTSKMSSSDPMSVIFLSDSAKDIKKKINKAFSGGKDTLEEHTRLGGNVDVDVPLEYLKFFCNDIFLYEEMRSGFASGTITSGKLKSVVAEVMIGVIQGLRN
jgi:tryptophanyl-tRNA synthetase